MTALVCALDTADLERLEELAGRLGGEVDVLKVGLEAFAAHGPAAVRAAGAHAPVFLDLKLHDIPATVAGAAAAAAGHGVRQLTVHAAGGPAMVAAAADAAPGVDVLAVTVLTSLDAAALGAIGHPPAEAQVPRLAALAVDAGAAGVVCAPGEVSAVRAAVGEGPQVVVPGIRPAGAARDDQARVGTPAEACADGASHLVVGRPLTRAEDPAAAARSLRAEIDAAAGARRGHEEAR